MNTGKKIALIGAGAVGCYVVLGLYDRFGDDFMLIAKGERAERLRTRGLVINGREYHPRVVSPAEAHAENLDFLIVSVKYTALRGTLDDIAEAVREDTAVVSLLNGVDSEQIIGERIGREHMLYAFIKIASTRKGNDVRFILPDGGNGISVGEVSPDGAPVSQARAEAFAALFEGTDVLCRVRADIMNGIWGKFAVNLSRNLPQAMLGVGAGAYSDSAYVADLGAKLRSEAAVMARAHGAEIPAQDFYAPADPAQRYSTLQDLDAGRETEIEMFSGAMVRMGRELGIPCPYNEVVYDVIKALEEKNRGVFDYGESSH